MNYDIPMKDPKPRRTVRAVLESVLEQETHLAALTREYSWKVRGAPLQSVKRLFAEQARQIEGWVGDLFACAKAVGVAAAPAMPREAAPVETAAASGGAVEEMLAHHERAVAELRQAVEALSQRDPHGEAVLLLNGLLEFHETSAWMLRTLLASPERAGFADLHRGTESPGYR